MILLREDKFIRVVGVMCDMSLMVPDGNVENLVNKIKNLRMGFLQILCLEKLYKDEAAEEG